MPDIVILNLEGVIAQHPLWERIPANFIRMQLTYFEYLTENMF